MNKSSFLFLKKTTVRSRPIKAISKVDACKPSQETKLGEKEPIFIESHSERPTPKVYTTPSQVYHTRKHSQPKEAQWQIEAWLNFSVRFFPERTVVASKSWKMKRRGNVGHCNKYSSITLVKHQTSYHTVGAPSINTNSWSIVLSHCDMYVQHCAVTKKLGGWFLSVAAHDIL